MPLTSAFLRRAVLSTKYENSTVRRMKQVVMTLQKVVLWHVRQHGDLFTGERADFGVLAPDVRLRVQSQLNEPISLAIRQQMQHVLDLTAGDVQAFARLELLEVPALLEREFNAPKQESLLLEEIVNFNAVPVAQVAQLIASTSGGSILATSLEKLGATILSRVVTALVTGLVQGYTVQETTRNVREIMGNTRAQAERIVRSEYVRASNQANLLTFQRNSQYIQAVKWVATLDKATCMQCAALDGKVYPNMGKAPLPVSSTHPNCRCTLVPVGRNTLGLKLPMGTRASQGGPVDARLSYPKWFAQQPASFQREVLGPTRYRL